MDSAKMTSTHAASLVTVTVMAYLTDNSNQFLSPFKTIFPWSQPSPGSRRIILDYFHHERNKSLLSFSIDTFSGGRFVHTVHHASAKTNIHRITEVSTFIFYTALLLTNKLI